VHPTIGHLLAAVPDQGPPLAPELPRDAKDNFTLHVKIPSNTTAEVWVPTHGGAASATARRARFLRVDGDYAVYSVRSGEYTFQVHHEPVGG
jgi:hypothetical protein